MDKGPLRRYWAAKYKGLAFRHLLPGGEAQPAPPADQRAPDFGEMQRAMLAALRSDLPLPIDMRRDLAHAFEVLCAGMKDELLTPITRAGGREHPDAKDIQADGIRYLRVREASGETAGAIDAVAAAYGVSRRAVGNWATAWREQPVRDLPPHVSYIEMMQISGRLYQRLFARAKFAKAR